MKYNLNNMEEDKTVVRIRAKKCNGTSKPEYKKMSVDPSLTSFDVLRNLLIRAFDIRSNFSISYLSTDDKGVDIYLSMLSDWDLEAAISTSCKPYLCLKIELRSSEKADEWDVIERPDAMNNRIVNLKNVQGGTIINNFLKSISKVFGLKHEDISSTSSCSPSLTPMSDVQFRMFQNRVGCLIHRDQFKLAVFQSGVEASLRKVVWRHLLDVYPEHLNGQERMEHLKKKSNEYYELRENWRSRMSKKTMPTEEKQIINTVKKDVLRTDRHHSFFSGADDNHSSLMLLNILVTYAFTHPDVSYCQGMSDLASPLLVIQNDEATTYICFCALMLRLKNNFLPDGIMMTSKFQHLSLLLEHHDPDFAERLKNHRLEADLFFCYRWILLEMKREFPLDEAAYVLEVMWSTLPTRLPGREGVPLVDPQFLTSACFHPQSSLGYINLKKKFSVEECDRSAITPVGNVLESPCDDNSSAMEVVDVNIAEYLELGRKSMEIERSLESSLHDGALSSSNKSFETKHNSGNLSNGQNIPIQSTKELQNKTSPSKPSMTNAQFSKTDSDPAISDATADIQSLKDNMKLDLTEEVEEAQEDSCLLDSGDSSRTLPAIPPPHEFGCGNPFLMFLCLSLLLQYRDQIMDHKMDYNDVAMFFDRLVRRHNAASVVSRARILYCSYVRCQREMNNK